MSAFAIRICGLIGAGKLGAVRRYTCSIEVELEENNAQAEW